MVSEEQHVDADIAKNLTNAAKEALDKPQAPSGTDVGTPAHDSSPALEFI